MATRLQTRHWTDDLLAAADLAVRPDLAVAIDRWQQDPDQWAWVEQALRDGRGLASFPTMLQEDAASWGLSTMLIAPLIDAALDFQTGSLRTDWKFLVRKPLKAAFLPRIRAGLDAWFGTIPDIVSAVRQNPYLLIQLPRDVLVEWMPAVDHDSLRTQWLQFLDGAWNRAPDKDPAKQQQWRDWAAVLAVLLDRFDHGDTFIYLNHPRFDQKVRPHLRALEKYVGRSLPDADAIAMIREVVDLSGRDSTPIARSYGVIRSKDNAYEKVAWMWIYSGERTLASAAERRLLHNPLYAWPNYGDAVVAQGYHPPNLSTPVPFDASQVAALKHAFTHPLTILAAPPGTGKTSVIWGLWTLAQADPELAALDFLVLTPTGRAARVVNDRIPQLFPPARTLHSYIALSQAQTRQSPDINDLSDFEGFIVVDEAFATDAGILGALVRSIGPKGRLVLVGDPDQVLPVTGGSPALDIMLAASKGLDEGLIAADHDPLATLYINHRSVHVIPDNGRALWSDPVIDTNTGQPLSGPIIAQHKWDAQHFPQLTAPTDLATLEDDVLSCVQTWEAQRPAGVASEAFWHIVTARRSGAAHLNRMIRAALFPHQSAPWVVGERVMQLRNDYLLNGIGLRNGEFGHITAINGDTLTAEFSSGVFIVTTQYANVHWGYAYASTVHKAQGGEWPYIAVVDVPDAWLQAGDQDPVSVTKWPTRVLYTAWSRGREAVWFITPDVDAVSRATRDPHKPRMSNGGRLTQLRGWLMHSFRDNSGLKPSGQGVRKTL